MKIRARINGELVERELGLRTTLQSFLHGGLGRTEVKLGCGEGACGACVVLVDGQPQASCLLLAAQCDGREIVTAGGLFEGGHALSPIAGSLGNGWAARDAFQCGYCAPGMAVSSAHLAGAGEVTVAEARAGLAGHLCRCTGYQPIVEALVEVAQRRAPSEGAVCERAAGRTRYVTDLHLEGEEVARIAWSERASAEILEVDTAAARAVPGVRAVLTARDVPGRNVIQGVFLDDQPLLADRVVRSLGDAVAIIVARSDASAREAVRRLRVRYRDLPPVLDPESANEEGAPRVGGHRNTIAQFTEEHGDYPGALARSEVVVEGRYECTPNDHVCLEPEGGVAFWEGEELVLRSSTLTPHTVRAGVALALGLPEPRIRVETPPVGGSFGKYLQPGVEALLALAAYHARAPVRLVLDRAEILERRPKRHPLVMRYTLGLDRDGTFRALGAEMICDSGPYVAITPTLVSVFANEAAGAYRIADIRVWARGVLTNNLLGAAMRGFGSQQVTFGIESIVEKAAHAIGMDPAELRRKNLRACEATQETLAAVVRQLGARPEREQGPWRRGRGVATVRCKYGYPHGMVDRFAARLVVESDGAMFLESDVPDSGTGLLPTIAQLVADELGLSRPPVPRFSPALADPTGRALDGRAPSQLSHALFRAIERLQILQAVQSLRVLVRLSPRFAARLVRWIARPFNLMNDLINRLKSALFPRSIDSFVPRTSGSRGAMTFGRAALAAADELRRRCLAVAAQVLGAEVVWTPAGPATREAAPRVLSLPAIAAHAGGRLIATGTAANPNTPLLDPSTGNQLGPLDHMLTTHGVDLEIHRETGEVRLLRYVACQDVGRALDPVKVRGQIAGGIAMGIGQALWEDAGLVGGRITNGSLRRYHVPSASEAVDPIIVLLESGAGLGPRGAKGVGEAAAVASPIAVAHAVFDALGAQPDALPITAEEILSLSDR